MTMGTGSTFYVLALLAVSGNCDIFRVDDYFPRNRYSTYSANEKCETKNVLCFTGDSTPTFDGSCNNRNHPTWGATNTPLARLLPAEYADSKERPRASGNGSPLPSTRLISNRMKESDKKESSAISHMHVLWGQLLAHDIVHTPIVKNTDGSNLNCGCQNPHPECINIEIPGDDEQFLKTGKTCMSLARSRPAVGVSNCKFEQREQINQLSSVIDGTMVYGKTAKEVEELRDLSSQIGQLKTGGNPTGGPHKLLPTQDEMKGTGISGKMDCPMKVHKPKNVGCFVAGDVRNNENTGLASIVTIWMRYHNKVAKGLSNINPTWNSNKIFNTARRIITALIQIITYREYIPLLVGDTWVERFDLKLAEEGYWNGYDPQQNPAITTEFTTAAFRYGHSQVAASLSRPGIYFNKNVVPNLKSEESWFNSEPLLSESGGGVGAFMRGFMIDSPEQTDGTLVNDLRNQLFTETGKNFGGDLLAINLQRGRDHGIAGYNKYREVCGLPRANSFQELIGEIPKDSVTKLQTLYQTVDDIDLYIGGLLENHVPGGEVGPTFACILSYQFRAIRNGDRYWHEYQHSPAKFSLQQLKALRAITFSRILCDAGDDMVYVTRFSMSLLDTNLGRFTSCASLPDLDFSAWKDTLHVDSWKANTAEWTSWFVTDHTSKWKISLHDESLTMKKRHGDRVCDNVISYETRNVPGDNHVQIRFSCEVGTVKATDFPKQVLDDAFWSEWISDISMGYNDGTMIYSSHFPCSDSIAIQAQTTDGSQFAMETGDVFEDLSTSRGLTCRNKHQPSGMCHEYRVRVLCPTQHNSASDYNPYPPNTPYTIPVPPVSTPSNSHTTFYSFSSFPPPPFHSKAIPLNVITLARSYCANYDICCERISQFYHVNVPRFALKNANEWCRRYNICCTTLF